MEEPKEPSNTEKLNNLLSSYKADLVELETARIKAISLLDGQIKETKSLIRDVEKVLAKYAPEAITDSPLNDNV